MRITPAVLDADTSVPFRGSVARREGRVTLGRLRGPSFVPLYPDVYVGALAEITPALRRLALREWLGPDAVVAGSLAADAHSAPTVDDLVEVDVRSDRRPRHPAVLVHRDGLLPREVCEVDGVRVTSPARTAFDLARRLPLDDGVAMADALARHHPVDGPRLRTLAWQHPNVRGVRRVFDVARLVRPGAESLPESRLRVGIVLRGEPVVQFRVIDGARAGLVIARPDLAWPAFRLALEYDGAGHLLREWTAVVDLDLLDSDTGPLDTITVTPTPGVRREGVAAPCVARGVAGGQPLLALRRGAVGEVVGVDRGRPDDEDPTGPAPGKGDQS